MPINSSRHNLIAYRGGIAIIMGIFLACILSIITNYAMVFLNSGTIVRGDGEVLGGDFIGFYSVGLLAQQDRSRIYNFDSAFEVQTALLSDSNAKPVVLPFAYPPIMATFFESLSHLSYKQAYTVWMLFSFLLGVFSMAITARTLDCTLTESLILGMLTLSFAPFSIFCLAGGQTSFFGLLIVAGMHYFLKQDKRFYAGCLLGLSFYKPPLLAIYGIIQLMRRDWSVVFGAFVGVVVVISSSWLYVGTDGMISYVGQSLRYLYGAEVVPGYQLPPNQGVGLLSMMYKIFTQESILAWVLFGVLTLLFLFVFGRSTVAQPQEVSLQYVTDISVSLFLSVQMLRYDLTIMLVPLAIMVINAHRTRNFLLCMISLAGILIFYGNYFYLIQISPIGNPGFYAFALGIWVILIMLAQSFKKELGIISYGKKS